MVKYDYFILMASSRTGHNYVRSNVLSWLGTSWDKQDIIYQNWENERPLIYEAKLKRYNMVNNDKILVAVLTRDYLNWLASYIIMISETFYNNPQWDTRKYPPIQDTILQTVDAWEHITKEYFGITNYIPSSIKILYDDFFKDRMYRRNICDKMGGEYNENYLNVITQAGGGSSFDKFNYQKNAQQMNPYNRYLEIIDTEYKDIYIEILKKKYNVLKLYLKKFDVNDEQKNFIRNYVR